MIGLVLCGGESKRMGSDKGLLKKEDHTWAEAAETKLSALPLPTYLSVNKEQEESYSEIFSEEKLVVDNTTLGVKGPLLGLLSCHLNFRGEDVFVLACDMLDMTGQYLQELMQRYNSNKFEAYVYATEGRLQPLCGIYTSAALKKIFSLYERNELRKFSMMYMLDQLNTEIIEVESNAVSAFKNYNSPSELEHIA